MTKPINVTNRQEVINKDLATFLTMNEHHSVVNKVKSVANKYEHIQGVKFDMFYPSDMVSGELMPCIVAHTDTVQVKKPTKQSLVINHGVITNLNGVLGADDRAGCYAMWKLIQADVRAIYILTDEEEIGGIGANHCADSVEFTALEEFMSCLLELDRRGNKDVAIYGADNSHLIGIFEGMGYKEAYGSYTDVVTLAEVSDLACVNLSVGYDHEHTKRELLIVKHLEETITKLIDMPSAFYDRRFEQEEPKQNPFMFDTYTEELAVLCESCGEHAPLYAHENGTFCGDCVSEYDEVLPSADDDFWYGT